VAGEEPEAQIVDKHGYGRKNRCFDLPSHDKQEFCGSFKEFLSIGEPGKDRSEL
jgi:hypothetical protein